MVKQFLKYQESTIEVDDNYSFTMVCSTPKRGKILHFGYIELDGVRYSLVGFLDAHFRQKRSTIVNNIAKCLDLRRENEEIFT